MLSFVLDFIPIMIGTLSRSYLAWCIRRLQGRHTGLTPTLGSQHVGTVKDDCQHHCTAHHALGLARHTAEQRWSHRSSCKSSRDEGPTGGVAQLPADDIRLFIAPVLPADITKLTFLLQLYKSIVKTGDIISSY